MGSALLCEAKHDVLTFLCQEEREESLKIENGEIEREVMGYYSLDV
jgi:hypothetical protein